MHLCEGQQLKKSFRVTVSKTEHNALGRFTFRARHSFLARRFPHCRSSGEVFNSCKPEIKTCCHFRDFFFFFFFFSLVCVRCSGIEFLVFLFGPKRNDQLRGLHVSTGTNVVRVGMCVAFRPRDTADWPGGVVVPIPMVLFKTMVLNVTTVLVADVGHLLLVPDAESGHVMMSAALVVDDEESLVPGFCPPDTVGRAYPVLVVVQ